MTRYELSVNTVELGNGNPAWTDVEVKEKNDGDWVKWDDVQELLGALKEIRDVTDARTRWSIACAAIAKFEGTK